MGAGLAVSDVKHRGRLGCRRVLRTRYGLADRDSSPGLRIGRCHADLAGDDVGSGWTCAFGGPDADLDLNVTNPATPRSNAAASAVACPAVLRSLPHCRSQRLGARGALHVHNVAAAWQRLDAEEANDVECSAPRTGDGEPSSRGARGDNRRVHRWSCLPAPVRTTLPSPCPNPSDTCLAGMPIFRPGVVRPNP
jgi:hypothetical protein